MGEVMVRSRDDDNADLGLLHGADADAAKHGNSELSSPGRSTAAATRIPNSCRHADVKGSIPRQMRPPMIQP